MNSSCTYIDPRTSSPAQSIRNTFFRTRTSRSCTPFSSSSVYCPTLSIHSKTPPLSCYFVFHSSLQVGYHILSSSILRHKVCPGKNIRSTFSNSLFLSIGIPFPFFSSGEGSRLSSDCCPRVGHRRGQGCYATK